ncbi:MAG: RloB domain-containing protein [Lentisphaerae bacterium]|nr:RloB domain-containing protein [Lentisphaerota bacterium]
MSYYKRRSGTRRYKRRYLLVCEGSVTEPAYFNQLKGLYQESIINITCLAEKKSAPDYLIKRAEAAQADLRKGDELWIVLDVDRWTPDHFARLEKWAKNDTCRNVAVSNPCFEIWLVFHDKDPGESNKKACQAYYNEYIAHGTKSLRSNWLTSDRVKAAVTRAKSRDSNQDSIIPVNRTSRVYKFIENIEEFCTKYKSVTKS